MQNRLFIKNDFAYVLNTAIFFIPEIYPKLCNLNLKI